MRLEPSDFFAYYAVKLFQFHKGAIRTPSWQGADFVFKFQFHKGAIRTKPQADKSARGNYFNSIKVRLEQTETAPESEEKTFQFHKGAIRTKRHLQQDRHNTYFNSIKVRLELELRSIINALERGFQFHKGAIRTQAPRRALSFYTQFQFHKGAIRTY